MMDILATAKKIADRLLPFFFKSKTITQIGKDIGEATDTELGLLWKKVKPWFIEEYEAEKPLDETFEKDDVKATLKKGLKNADADMQNAIAEILKNLEQSKISSNNATATGTSNIIIQDTKDSNIQIHTGTGDNIKGDKKTYHINEIGKADFK